MIIKIRDNGIVGIGERGYRWGNFSYGIKYGGVGIKNTSEYRVGQ